MAPNYYFISFLFATFLLACCVLVQAREIPPFGDIALTREPDDNYYIVKKRPAIIVCEARNAADISFTCVDSQIPPSSIETEDSDLFIKAQIEVTRSDLFNHGKKKGPFWCECSALDFNGQAVMTSQRTTISVAFLKHKFKANPKTQQASEGENVEIMCGVPSGKPKPEVIWRKNKKRLSFKHDPRYTVTEQGTLVIESVESKDAGTYSCVAKNPAGRKESKGGKLTVSATAPPPTAPPKMKGADPTFPDDIPETAMFLNNLNEKYIVEPGTSAKLTCTVVSADQITFNCAQQRVTIEKDNELMLYDRDSRKRLVQSIYEVTAEEVLNGPDDFYCECTAWYLTAEKKWEYIKSNQGFIQVAGSEEQIPTDFIEDQFVNYPSLLTAEVGQEAEFQCTAPRGNPKPMVYWLKDGVRINPDENKNYYVFDEGGLVLEYVEVIDQGDYTCVAENSAGRKIAPAVRLTVIVPEEPTSEPDGDLYPPTTDYYDNYDSTDMFKLGPIFAHAVKDNLFIDDDGEILSCQAIGDVKHLVFVCNSDVVTSSSTTGTHLTDPTTGQKINDNALTISREMVETWVANNAEPYVCFCRAYYVKEGEQPENLSNKDSWPTKIEIAYFKKKFVVEPMPMEVSQGGIAELQCEPPVAIPPATVYWLKDGFNLIEDDRRMINAEGSLTINDFKAEDVGNYTCGASNEFKTRTSKTAAVSMAVFPMMNGCDMAKVQECSALGSQLNQGEPALDIMCSTIGTLINCFNDAIKECDASMADQIKSTIIMPFEEQAKVCPGSPMIDGCDMAKIQECSALGSQLNLDMMCSTIGTLINCYNDAIQGCDASIADQFKSTIIIFEEQAKACPVDEEVIMAEKGVDVEGSHGGDAEPSTEPEVEPTSNDGVMVGSLETPYISKDLHDTYYIIKRNPVTILCEAYNVEQISFSCMNKNVDETKIVIQTREEVIHQENGEEVIQKITEASFEVTKDDLDNKVGENDYMCQCFAHYVVPGMDDEQKLSSKMGFVEEGYIKKFKKSPENKMAKEGDFVSISCEAPNGNPMPTVYWTKDGEKVDDLYVMASHALIFDKIQVEDEGDYKCVAENDVGKRESDAITVEVEDAPDAEVGGEDKHGEEVVEGETKVDGENEPAVIEPKEGADTVAEVEQTGMTVEEGVGEPTGEIEGGNAEVVPEVEGSFDISEGGAAGVGSEQMGEGQTDGDSSDDMVNPEPMDKDDDMIDQGESKPSGEEIDDKEPAAGASMNDPSDGASSVSVSFLLAVLTQLVLATLLSWR